MSQEFSSVILREAVNLYVDLAVLTNDVWISHQEICRVLGFCAIVAVGIYVQCLLHELAE